MDIDVIAGGSDVQINLTSFLGGGEQYVNFPNFLRNRLYKKVTWNEVERAWLRLKKEAVNGPNYSLQKGIEYRLKESFTGCFLHHLNKGEDTNMEIQQKKLDIAKFLLRINEFPTVYERRHDYTENIMGLLVNTVSQSKNGVVTESSVLKNMPSLRLASSKIASMDYTLKDCSGLEALILTANYITDFDGIVLPSNLKLLELYGNLLFDIDLLAKNAPKRLLFIGLGRNYLSRRNISDLLLFQLLLLAHSIKLLNRFIYLCYLDLSDNDFENIDDLVQNLSYLKSLKSLQIIGNPCTVLSNYKTIVMLGLPSLEILDGVELDRRNHEPGQEMREAVLSIYGFRIYNIPKPIRVTMSKKEKVESYYQLEVELPLLDEKLAAYETNVLTHELNGVPLPIIPDLEEVPRTIERPPRKVAARIFRPSSMSKKGKKSEPTPRMKQHENEILENLESRYYDYLENDEEIFMAKKYLSNKVQWSPVIKFPSPALSVSVPLENIRMLRDTFRTVLNVRLYHKEEISLIPIGKSKSRIMASNRNSRLSVKKRPSKRVSVKIGKKQPKMGNGTGGGGDQKAPIAGNPIPVPLQMTNWAEDYMGYTWDIKDHCLARPWPGLKNINVGMKSRRGRVSAAKKDGYIPMPKMLTCHIGVGLKRTGTYERMLSVSKINLKKKSKVNKSTRMPPSRSSRGSKLSKQSKI